jgi:hypothetical protein
MLNSIREKMQEWLFPGLVREVAGLGMAQEAWFDIHLLNLPTTPEIWDNAVRNAQEFNEYLLNGRIEIDENGVAIKNQVTIDDRLKSLIEVLKRSNLIQEVQ